jgi:hypothetical protein
MIVSISAFRKLVLFAVLLLALAGCGSDDESNAPAQADTSSTAETTPTTDTESNPATETLPNDGNGNGTGGGTGGGTTAPESQTGGAGDEVPAQTLALFTARNGTITPRTVRVPAYISIRVELRSGDGKEYSLAFGDKTIEVPGQLNSASTTFAGLKPGAKLVGTPTGASGKVVVSATAEPGP